MAVNNSSLLSMLDWAKRTDPDGKFQFIVEMLAQDNAMLDDMPWQPCNQKTAHRTTLRTSLPTPVWRLVNQYTQPTKSTTAQATFGTGILDAWSELDPDGVNGDLKKARLTEAMAHLESMAQEMQQTVIYGSAANPEEFLGFSPYYSNLTDNSAENIIDAGGTQSDNMSIWLVGWGDRSTYGIFPEGSTAGLERKDYGLSVSENTSGRMAVYREQFKWKAGLVVEDWRKTVRIANIDKSSLVADGAGTSVKLIEYMIDATHRQWKPTTVNSVFYVNRVTAKMLDIQAQNKTNVYLTVGMEEGKRKLSFRGIPIKTVDALVDNETRIVA